MSASDLGWAVLAAIAIAFMVVACAWADTGSRAPRPDQTPTWITQP